MAEKPKRQRCSRCRGSGYAHNALNEDLDVDICPACSGSGLEER
jgi:DnaJ-class molecular chaperone